MHTHGTDKKGVICSRNLFRLLFGKVIKLFRKLGFLMIKSDLQRIYLILDISRKEMAYCCAVWVFLVNEIFKFKC